MEKKEEKKNVEKEERTKNILTGIIIGLIISIVGIALYKFVLSNNNDDNSVQIPIQHEIIVK